MSQKTIVLIVIFFTLLVAGMFIFADLKQTELESVTPDVSPVIKDSALPYSQIDRIDAKHYFIDGTHTLAGELIMPTPCDLVETSALVRESYPEQVTVDFSVLNNAEDCIQVETAYRFKVSFTASEQAFITAVFMGRDIALNLTPAAITETPEEFELFIKG